MHEKRIEIRARDLDNLGHVNNAVYLTYLEEARDEWLARVLGDAELTLAFVVAHVSIDFRRELVLDDDLVVVSCLPNELGRSSIRTRERICTASGDIAAEAEAVLVARDGSTGGSRPLTDAERTALERERAHA